MADILDALKIDSQTSKTAEPDLTPPAEPPVPLTVPAPPVASFSDTPPVKPTPVIPDSSFTEPPVTTSPPVTPPEAFSGFPAEPSPVPQSEPTTQPPVYHETQTTPEPIPEPVPDKPTDSLIVPPKDVSLPGKKSNNPPPDLTKKKRSPVGAILLSMVLLLIMLPVAIYFITQQQQLADTRSRAAASCIPLVDCNGNCSECSKYPIRNGNECCPEGPYPATSAPLPACKGPCMITACSSTGMVNDSTGSCPDPSQNCCKSTTPPAPLTCAPFSSCASADIGDECSSPKGVCYTCKNNPSNPAIPKMWAPCGGTPNCPWPLTNGKCCPTGKDACSTPGSIVCIEDPYASRCVPWDNSCPAGQRYVYQAFDWCTEPGCYESYLIPKYGCSNVTTTQPPSSPEYPQCKAIKVYKNNQLVTDYSTLRPGNTISVAVAGTMSSKARARINGGAYSETTTKNTQGEYVISNIVLPTGVSAITIEAQTFGTDSAWH